MTASFRRDDVARVRNLLAACRSVIKQTLEESASLDDVSLHLVPRFDAIARFGASTLLGEPTEVEDIVRDLLLDAHEREGARTTINGPPVALTARQAPVFGLAVHELVTNAIKFGALGHDDATLAVTWNLIGDRGDRLRFRWTESGVPIVTSAPLQEGFGRRFIEHGVPYQLNAEASFELRPGGIRCEMILPDVRPVEPTGSLENSSTQDTA